MIKSSSRWFSFGIIYLCSFAGTLAVQSIPPILSLIIKDLQISHAEAGLMMSITSLPAIFLAVPMGALADRFGAKRLIILAVSSVITGTLLVSFSANYPLLLAGRILTGLGGSMIAVLGSQVLTHLFIESKLGLAMSIFQTTFPVTILITMNVLANLASAFSWRSSILTGTILGIVVLIVFIIFFRTTPQKTVESGHDLKKRSFPINQIGWPLWLLAICSGLFFAMTLGLFTFTPDFLVGQGIDLKLAALYTSTLVLIPLPSLPFVGLLLDKVKYKEIMVVIGALGSGTLIFLLPNGIQFIIPLLLGIGMLNCIIPASFSALIPHIVKRENIGLSLGIVASVSNLIALPGLYLLGLCRDKTGNYFLTYLLIAIACLIMAILISIIWMHRRNLNKQS